MVVGSIGIAASAGMGAFTSGGPGNPLSIVPGLAAALICGAFILFYRSREMTRFRSQVHLGNTDVAVSIRARSLIGQYLLFGLAVLLVYIALAIGGIVVLFMLANDAFAGDEFDMALFMSHLQGSTGVLIAVVVGYLLILAAFNFMHELFIRVAFWKLVARHATISDIASLRSVRAEDKTLTGEGLADALNVGAY